MKFIDEAKIHVRSGKGGPGAVSFRREKFIPRGGPDGGDGGAGGSVIFEVDPQVTTLLDLKFRQNFLAGNGEPGDRQNMSGRRGDDVVIKVPRGTVIRSGAGAVICDLSEQVGRFVFLSGGRGGKGNNFFKNSVNQAPKFAQPGEEGQTADVQLELKLIADVGIIGLPNAGKSTLISRISAARPKIADYPFTTLVPNLGVVQGPDFKSFVVADIPGLVRGAHKGTGLGIKFLRHIERTHFFVHLIDASSFAGEDTLQAYDEINFELSSYDKAKKHDEGFFELSTRPQLVVLNKTDLLSDEEQRGLVKKFEKRGISPQLISAATGQGVRSLINKMVEVLSEKTN